MQKSISNGYCLSFLIFTPLIYILPSREIDVPNSVSQQKTIRQRTNKGKESWGGMTTGIEPDMN